MSGNQPKRMMCKSFRGIEYGIENRHRRNYKKIIQWTYVEALGKRPGAVTSGAEDGRLVDIACSNETADALAPYTISYEHRHQPRINVCCKRVMSQLEACAASLSIYIPCHDIAT